PPSGATATSLPPWAPTRPRSPGSSPATSGSTADIRYPRTGTSTPCLSAEVEDPDDVDPTRDMETLVADGHRAVMTPDDPPTAHHPDTPPRARRGANRLASIGGGAP